MYKHKCVMISVCLLVFGGKLREIQFDDFYLVCEIGSEGDHLLRMR